MGHSDTFSQTINVFISTADLKFGPITIICRPGQPTKKIPWTAFQLSNADWERVRLCADILAVRMHTLSPYLC